MELIPQPYKNIYDWVSRIDGNVWMNKPMFLMATSPGARGGQGVLNLAAMNYGFANKNTIAQFSLPSFYQNFSNEEGISEAALDVKFREQLSVFLEAVTSSS